MKGKKHNKLLNNKIKRSCVIKTIKRTIISSQPEVITQISKGFESICTKVVGVLFRRL